jgi:hypothetical protein
MSYTNVSNTEGPYVIYTDAIRLAGIVTVTKLAGIVTVTKLAGIVTVTKLAGIVTVTKLAGIVTVTKLAGIVTVRSEHSLYACFMLREKTSRNTRMPHS